MADHAAIEEQKASHAQSLVAFSDKDRMVIPMNVLGIDRLVCRGLQVADIVVPSFSVGPGEIVKLNFPSGHDRERNLVLSTILDRGNSRIECNGLIATVELPMTRSPLREMFHKQTAVEWLMRRCRLSRQDATAGLRRVGVQPDVPIGFLAGNPRWLIGFAAAMSQRPAALVFTTAYCDATGVQRALATASSHLGSSAGVYLTCDPYLEIDEPAYAATLNATVDEQQVVA